MPSTKHSAWPILVQKYLSDKWMKGKASVDGFNPQSLKPYPGGSKRLRREAQHSAPPPGIPAPLRLALGPMICLHPNFPTFSLIMSLTAELEQWRTPWGWETVTSRNPNTYSGIWPLEGKRAKSLLRHVCGALRRVATSMLPMWHPQHFFVLLVTLIN